MLYNAHPHIDCSATIKKNIFLVNAVLSCIAGLTSVIYGVFQEDLQHIINALSNGFLVFAVGVFSFWCVLNNRLPFIIYSYLILFVFLYLESFKIADPSLFSIVKFYLYTSLLIQITIYYEFRISLKFFLVLVFLLVMRQLIIEIEFISIILVYNNSLIQLLFFELCTVYCLFVAGYYQHNIKITYIKLNTTNSQLKNNFDHYNQKKIASNSIINSINTITGDTTLAIRKHIDYNLSLLSKHNNKNIDDLIKESTIVSKEIDLLLKKINKEIDVHE